MSGDDEVTIAVIYPELLGTYGDNGNVVVLHQRLTRRGIPARVLPVQAGETIPESCDLYLVGGAEDGSGRTAAEYLRQQPGLARAVEAGRPVLAVCAGMQLLGHEVLGSDGRAYSGLGLLDVTTSPRETRAIGEVVAQPLAGPLGELLTGFENHRGGTRLGPDAQPLARVLRGVGNGADVDVEGARQGSIVATYLHGPVLARNPALADLLLQSALGRPLGELDVEGVARLRTERLATLRRRPSWRARVVRAVRP